MELVEGKRLLSFCDDDRRTLHERLEIFARVCDAVHFAHQQGLIHRDLSPDNILVSLDAEGRPQPKVIDFGVAKAVNPGARLGDATLVTDWHAIIGKPEYLSPEQAEGGPIDTRSDVFALGVILYELLTGALPVSRESLRSRSIDEAFSQIRTVERPAPLTRFRSLDARSRTGAALARGLPDESALARLLQGRIRHLPMKALRQDRARRYSSAAAFATDVRAFLEGRDFIEADSEPWMERFTRRVRRHRLAYASAALVVAGILLGVVGIALGYRAALEARDRAEASARLEREAHQDADRARRVAERRFELARAFASRMQLELVPLVQDLAGATPVVDFLAHSTLEHLRSLEVDAGDHPELRRDIATGYIRAGDALRRRGDPDGAERAFREALALAALDPAPAARRLVSMAHERLGRVASTRLEHSAAIDSYARSLEIRRQLAAGGSSIPEDSRAVVIAIQGIGDALDAQGRLEEALERYDEASELLRRQLPVGGPQIRQDLALTLMRSASTLERSRRPDEALVQLRAAHPLLESAMEEEPSNTAVQRDLAVVLAMIGERLSARGETPQARASIERAAAIFERLTDADPASARAARDAALVQESLASMAEAAGEHDAAVEHRRRATERFERLVQRSPSDARARLDHANSLRALGGALAQAGGLDEALAVLQRSADVSASCRRTRPEDMQAAREESLSRLAMGRALTRAGRLDEASAELESAQALSEVVAAAQPDRARVQRELAVIQEARADVLEAQGDAAGAAELAARAISIFTTLADRDPSNAATLRDLGAAHDRHARLLRSAGRGREAREACLAAKTFWSRLLASGGATDDDRRRATANEQALLEMRSMSDEPEPAPGR